VEGCHHLVVHPGHRHLGIGRSLLQAGTLALAREHIEKCHLLVFRRNPEGIAFWRSVSAAERSELVLFSVSTQADA
jgi:putative acetyltransferase